MTVRVPVDLDEPIGRRVVGRQLEQIFAVRPVSAGSMVGRVLRQPLEGGRGEGDADFDGISRPFVNLHEGAGLAVSESHGSTVAGVGRGARGAGGGWRLRHRVR